MSITDHYCKLKDADCRMEGEGLRAKNEGWNMVDSNLLEGGRGCLILLCQYVNIRKGREAMGPFLNAS